ncbi:tetratricopeptide repeat-containing sensor histidine kinase [Hymenobacter taeanensis]|uniref:histidine kinase n=1 Tax=Hymenobacter taeanensis TaxID=2735321 RepID=A0A6M6BH24_9BACT|nr:MULTISPECIES: tetratricopeptide repeat-containing sensor histidine kinase [Hymenobacter]QJX47124.1 tetratricopeptide repeat-containing sensor histidine kinase [Hymenobacter taeanensis]UOQ81039.1 tetratricopeptide repeat-containing sensor histidine kinase [Hymenobacter sp. 5414T-23]
MQRFLFAWLLLIAYPIFGQTSDEQAEVVLLRQLATQPADTGRVRQLASLCYVLHDSAPTRAIPYGEQAVRLARRLHDDHGLLRSLLVLSSSYANISDGPHALLLQRQALVLARRLHDMNGIVRSYTGMGGVHHERGDTAAALLNYQRALDLVYRPGVQVRTQLILFGNLGNLYFHLKKHQDGLLFTRRALQLARRTGDIAGESLYLADLGSYYLRLEQLGTAEGLLREALGLVAPLHQPRYESGHLELLANVLYLQGNLREAEQLTRRAMQLARQINYHERVLDAYSLLADINASRKNYEAALSWQQMFRNLNDTLNNRSRLQVLTALQARYESVEKENQIRLLTERSHMAQHRNRELWTAVALLLLALGGMGFMYAQLRRSRAALAENNATLQEATLELRQLAASKDRLYSIVAHDLRGPVTSFSGVTELIDFYLQRGDEEGLRRLPDIVRQAAQNLNSLLDNLLNWAVSQTGELAFQPERLLVADLLTELTGLYSTSAEAKQITLQTSCSPTLAIWADPHMTRTVLRNLISNALKFTPVEGTICLEAEALPRALVQISVTDTGLGMPPKQVAALLAPEGLVLPAQGPRSGTGLGLMLCRAFTQRQGGTLQIKSLEGQGTTVSVTLPNAQR